MNLKTNTGIYSITHRESGKRYIGSTYCNFYDRFCAHRSTLHNQKHSSILLQRAYNAYGLDSFSFEILEVGAINLDQRELYYMNLYQSFDPKLGYNISRETNNHRLGHQQSEESKRKISIKLKNIVRSEATKIKMSQSKHGKNNPQYGKKQPAEMIAKRVKNNLKQIIRDDGKVYSSLKEAALDLGCKYQGISASLRKGYKVKGYRFYYEKR